MAAKLERVQPVLMVRDVEASIAFYGLLGFEEVFRDEPVAPRYAGVRRDGIELHLQWHDAKEWDYPNDRPTYRFVVQDVEGLFAEFTGRGALSERSVVRDTPWGRGSFMCRIWIGMVCSFIGRQKGEGGRQKQRKAISSRLIHPSAFYLLPFYLNPEPQTPNPNRSRRC